jgi:hypothetical protein
VSPSDRSCHRRDLSRPPSSLKDARAAGFLAPVAPLTFALRCSRLMSFLRRGRVNVAGVAVTSTTCQ